MSALLGHLQEENQAWQQSAGALKTLIERHACCWRRVDGQRLLDASASHRAVKVLTLSRGRRQVRYGRKSACSAMGEDRMASCCSAGRAANWPTCHKTLSASALVPEPVLGSTIVAQQASCKTSNKILSASVLVPKPVLSSTAVA